MFSARKKYVFAAGFVFVLASGLFFAADQKTPEVPVPPLSLRMFCPLPQLNLLEFLKQFPLQMVRLKMRSFLLVTILCASSFQMVNFPIKWIL